MKNRVRFLLTRLVKKDVFWKATKPIASIGYFLFRKRKQYELAQIEIIKKRSNLEILNHTLEVLNGPFKGMKYPSLQSVGSTLYPKLLGSYEMEIQYQIEDIATKNYSEIIDIGCAEGYYAIGMALKCKSAKIYAFDINEKARQLCKEMAVLNNVDKRVIVKSEFTAEKLKNFEFSERGLIICDCEGYEKLLFNESNISNLKNCDLIIETHDLIDIEITTYLKKLIKDTHNIVSIYSKDDIHKALDFNFKELNGLNLNKKREILSENRKAIMEWLVCIPKGEYKN
jgi:hypothetical protein